MQTAPAGPYAPRVASSPKLIDGLDAEEALFNGRIAERLRDHTGYPAIQQLPGIGTTLAAALVAEIGDAHRFASADRLCSCAGLTPWYYESDTAVRRGHVTKQGSKLVCWAMVEAIQCTVHPQDLRGPGPDRGRNIAKIAAARKPLMLVYYGLRDGQIRAPAHRTA
ncbi:transposase [Streptomyces camelliae]|uniref:Transposase n=1 Tax=Streptomyces camelliae TaxID=3004093 RepID=A0ABY7PED6_9ACTN|nr:transposase [Streptomyces sp. HUAS 2-6]WBO68737.1 transposase [Streptomyces sp. HUAS 2-6]